VRRFDHQMVDDRRPAMGVGRVQQNRLGRHAIARGELAAHVVDEIVIEPEQVAAEQERLPAGAVFNRHDLHRQRVVQAGRALPSAVPRHPHPHLGSHLAGRHTNAHHSLPSTWPYRTP